MAFTVNDFHDLVVILGEQPQWREEMRRLVLSDDILALPQQLHELAASVRALSEAQKRYETRSEERFDRVDNEIVGVKTDLSEFKANTDVRFNRVDKDIAELKTDVSQLKTDVGGLKGSNLERQFRERPFVYLNRFALRLQLVSDAEVANLLENAFDEGLLTDEEVEDAKLADVVARGRNRKDRSPLYLVAEISSVVDAYDLERSVRRAAIVAKATKIFTLPVVGGEKVDLQIQQQATQRGVGWVVSRIEN